MVEGKDDRHGVYKVNCEVESCSWLQKDTRLVAYLERPKLQWPQRPQPREDLGKLMQFAMKLNMQLLAGDACVVAFP